ncbi:TIGR04222 domain-containing membrane protein [Kitasatospora sp. NPDC051853]|uniref:TIGR04222 domain-containing membrane protein n=1 Tax=Kitasatospora sp. NPDC051853 TaxID=3364058 RepID=UPI0037B8AF50
MLLVASLAVVSLTRWWIRRAVAELYRAEREKEAEAIGELDLYQLARLAQTVKPTVLVVMHEQGRLTASPEGTVTVTDPVPGDEVEAALIEAAGPSRTVRITAVAEAALIRGADRDAELVRRGLLLDRALYERLVGPGATVARAVAVLVLLSAVVSAWWLAARGEDLAQPLLLHTVLFGVALRSVFRCAPDWRYRTALGDRALAEARADAAGAPLTRAVALHGLSALPAGHDLLLATATAEAEDRRRFDELMQRYREASERRGRG